MRRVLILSIGVVLIARSPVYAQGPREVTTSLADRQSLVIVAHMYGFDPDLLVAIARVESHENPDAVSLKGAQGLMQLMPATAMQYGVSDPFDLVDNALGAARYLSHLRSWQFSHPEMRLPEMLAAYNAGEGAVLRYGGIPPYAETQKYVRDVLTAYLLDVDRFNIQATVKRVHSTQSMTLHTSIERISSVRLSNQNRFDIDTLDRLQEIKRRRSLALKEGR